MMIVTMMVAVGGRPNIEREQQTQDEYADSPRATHSCPFFVILAIVVFHWKNGAKICPLVAKHAKAMKQLRKDADN